MKRGLCAIGALLLALFIAGPAGAQAPVPGTIVVENPWARATPGAAKISAGYMTLINKGPLSDRLLGAASPLAEKVQFHKETEESGVSRMRQVQAVEIQPGGKVVFKPGELHMMILGLKRPLREGDSLPLTLQLEKAGNIDVSLTVEKVGATQPGSRSQ
jgi:copper(I)-binding protein